MDAKKNELRRRVFARRDLVTPGEARAAAAIVAKRGLAFTRERATPGAAVAAYWPMRSEIHTRPLMESLTAAGFRTVLPVTRESRILLFRLWSVGDDLSRGALGNAEPLPDAEEVTPALLFVPLAAFDARGGRIGYGGGHYDTTLATLRARGPVVAAGLAYDLQEVETVPLEPHDQRLDAVITETRTLTFGPA